MATEYEVFERGGIAHLVEKAKEYADRDGGTGTEQIADGSVTTEKLGVSAVTTTRIADGAVSGGKIGNGTITSANMAAGSVTAQKIADGAVTDEKLDANGVRAEVSRLREDIDADRFSLHQDPDTKELFPVVNGKTSANGTLVEVGDVPAENIVGMISAEHLPSYVDEVVDGYLIDGAMYEDDGHQRLIVGEKGKIYYDLLSQRTYRWTGSAYAPAGPSDYVLPTMSATTKGGAKVGAGLSVDGTTLSVDYGEVASTDALESATAISPTGGLTRTSDGLAIDPDPQQSTGEVSGSITELTAKGHAEQETTTGKNLLPNNAIPQTINGVTFTVNADGSITANGTATARAMILVGMVQVSVGSTYTASGCSGGNSATYMLNYSERDNGEWKADHLCTRVPISFSPIYDVIYCHIIVQKDTILSDITFYPQLELGSTATPYEPYTGGKPSPSPEYAQEIEVVRGHEVDGTRYVDMLVRDSQGTLLSTTPIPLPSRGWVAGLPDGTADTLTLDGAGKVTWELGTKEKTYERFDSYKDEASVLRGFSASKPAGARFDGSSITRNFISTHASVGKYNTSSDDDFMYIFGANILLRTVMPSGYTAEGLAELNELLSQTPMVVLYKLATPTTESLGYIDMPSIPGDCTVSIPELDSLGVKYLIGDAARQMAEQWYERASVELGDAIVDLAAEVTTHEGRISKAESRLDARGTVYGFHVDSGESDSYECVTYLADAIGKTPAHMDYANQRFDWGGWSEDDFFMPRPCMLKYDGTVDYYLDPMDYSKKLDGTASDVANPDYGGNAMMEWGRDGKLIWYKVVPDADPTSYSVYIADNKVDDAYVCYPFVNGDGETVKHFYTPCYFGTVVNDGTKDVLRSLSGQLGSARCKSKTATVERTMAKANNPDGIDIWDTEVYADVILVNLLLTLISKSLDSQTAFGQGLNASGSDSVNDGFTSGQHDSKGLFWGTNSGAAATYSNAVKVFGMENWWGFMWRRFVGLVAVNGTEKYKLTRGVQDGSTATDYVVSTTGSAYDGYLEGGSLPTASGSYIKKMEFARDGSYTPTVVGGSATTYYRDALWTNLNAVTFAYRGGSSNSGALVGAWCLYLYYAASGAYWALGAAPSCKPQSQRG